MKHVIEVQHPNAEPSDIKSTNATANFLFIWIEYQKPSRNAKKIIIEMS